MNFVVDAIHTLDLRDANRTTDLQINDVADREHRVVITKDADFVDSHLLHGRPPKLLLISTGNISNRDLETLVVPLIPDIVREFASHLFLELGKLALRTPASHSVVAGALALTKDCSSAFHLVACERGLITGGVENDWTYG